MPAQLSFSSCISSVRDEIQRINSQKADVPDIRRSGQVPQFPRKGDEDYREGESGDAQDVPVGLVHPIPDSPVGTVSDSETSSNVSSVSAATAGSRCERARKGDIYTMERDEEVSRIIAEINAGHLISNTKCAPWGPGSKHNPNHPDTLRVRCQISSGPKTRDQITAALPGLPKKLIGSILHELREQGIVSIKRSGKK